MSAKNLCFFSARCPFSQSFLEQLAKTPYSKEFRFISVDAQPNGQRPSLPPYVKAVPTLMIDGEREPRTDSQVMNWLSERRLKDTASTNSGSKSGGAANGGGGEDGLAAFSDEMAISGDEWYAFIGEDATATKGNMVRMVGTMASFDDPTKVAAAEAASAPPARQTAKAKALDDALMAYQQMRDKDMRPAGNPMMGSGGPSASQGFASTFNSGVRR